VSSALVGGLLGAMAGVGLWIVLGRLVGSRRPSLESRLAPYVRDVPSPFDSWTPDSGGDRASSALVAVVRPLLQAAAARLENVLGGRESVRRRLVRAGSALSVEQFRLSQVLWGLGAFAAGLLVGASGPARSPGRALPWLAVCAGLFVVGVLARENALNRQVRLRERQMLAEFPVVADLLALAVAAGEGPVAALDRVVRSCPGALGSELSRVLSQARTGDSMSAALDALARRTGLPVVSRFAEGFAVALERGTPLVDVLSAQAADVREASRRELIETGARKEVAMMVPVVFLILPTTLLFAFYPGVVGLELLAP
jgi:tight adherence protein C